MKKLLLALVAACLLPFAAFAQTPQPIALTGVYTIAPGPDNLQSNYPAGFYCYNIAWAVDRPGGSGYMAADCGLATPAWVTNAGPQGNPGATGATGSTGPAGADGKTVLSGTGAPGGIGANGDYYLDVTTYRLYGPKTSGVWGTGVVLIGPAGPTGSTGGAGSPGTAATVAVGTVTTGSPGSSASFTNVGTPTAAVLNITIPRGDVGATGATGSAGTNGTNGTNGAAGVNSFGAPNARTLSLATAYQATDNTKPAVITINLTSTASISLTGGTTNTADVVMGTTTGVASGTGTQICKYANTNTGALTIGLNLSTVSAATCTFALRAGDYFAIRTTAGTVTITSAYDQAVG